MMDTSEQYLKMRLAAISDLGMGTPPLQLSRFYTELVWVDIKGDWYTSDGDDAPQLECQDQLQEMLGELLWQLNFKFIDWLCDTPYDGHIRHCHLNFTSMEQLWLAFVMKEKYNKVWDGETWT